MGTSLQVRDSAPGVALRIEQALRPDQIAAARRLFLEYAASLNYSLCFQGFDQEVAQLPGLYVPPSGRLLLAVQPGGSKGEDIAGGIVGCVALRPLETGVCEMKRLYVPPEFRGRGIGERLATEVIAAAQSIGYRHMRLDTLHTMQAAQALYRGMGFKPIAPYYPNPIPHTEYLELDLGTAAASRENR